MSNMANKAAEAIPKVKAEEEEEEELQDPQETLRDQCRPKCNSYMEKLNGCNERVESRSKTTESCVEEVIDFMHCLDTCVSKDLFRFLK